MTPNNDDALVEAEDWDMLIAVEQACRQAIYAKTGIHIDTGQCFIARAALSARAALTAHRNYKGE